MPQLPEVIGVIYPFPESVIKRIVEKRKRILVKFTTHEPTKKTKMRLRAGMKLYLYQSQSKKIVVGEADISKYEYLLKEEILDRYKYNLSIGEDELNDYVGGRISKKLLVLHLKNPKLYKKPIQMKSQLTMTGLYVTNENKKSIFGKK